MRRSDFSFANLGLLKICAVASTVIFAATVVPLLGGLPKGYELRELSASFAAWMKGETPPPQADPVLYPHHNDSAPMASPTLDSDPAPRRRLVNAAASEADTGPLEVAQAEPLEGAISDSRAAAVSDVIPAEAKTPADGENEAAPEALAVDG